MRLKDTAFITVRCNHHTESEECHYRIGLRKELKVYNSSEIIIFKPKGTTYREAMHSGAAGHIWNGAANRSIVHPPDDI
jgi:hypothetical protein